ncbi:MULTISPECIES: hypothetical protein [Halomonadaceae]|uniref:Uncharacterized protein n=1 Tax=Billgrantia gudaonensis TaxID=376427 RepID=A0A1G8YBT6_9GAMM|nr:MULTISPECIES: hypothetical protein [Halomonas]SDJ99864.1 hypothetical protein SAMN04487954_11051 [Halomonas gudaonensis]
MDQSDTTSAQITAHELLYDLVPKLKSTEELVYDVLTVRMQTTSDPEVHRLLKGFKTEFELEGTMIRMNLKNLLRRYADVLEAVKSGRAGRDEHPLMLDEYEAAAVARVRQLYRKAQQLTG